MTFVGKILVVAIMFFSLCFLALSGMVFTSATNWRAEAAKQKDLVKKYQSDLGTAEAKAAKAQEDIKAAADLAKGELDTRAGKITDLTAQNEQLERERTDAVRRIETAIQNMTIAQAEAEARAQELDQLRKTLASTEEEGNKLKITETQLNETIRELEIKLAAANQVKKSLQENVDAYASFLTTKGINVDITQIKRVDRPPTVNGEVTRVDPTGRRLEISIGSDDGLVEGHELLVFRYNPVPEFIGRIRIVHADPDKSVAVVVGGQTYQGKKIREGDRVANKISPGN